MAENKKPNPQLSKELSKTKAKNTEFQRARGLESTKREIQGENINPTGEKNKNFDRDTFEKNMDKRDAEIEKRLNRNENAPQSKKPISKSRSIKKVLDKVKPFIDDITKPVAKKFIPFMTIAESFEATPTVSEEQEQRELQEWKESQEKKFETITRKQPESISEIKNDKDLLFAMDENGALTTEDTPIIIEEYEREGVNQLIYEIQNIRESGFPEDLEPLKYESFEVDMGDPSMDSSDGDDGSADGGADGGGDGGGGSGAGE